MKKTTFLLFTFFVLHNLLLAQSKKPLNHEVYDSWNDIRNKTLSDDGNWFLYTLTPQEGDATLKIQHLTKKDAPIVSVPRGKNAIFTKDNQFVIFKIKPQLDTVKTQKRAKVKKKDMSKDSLGIYALAKDSLLKIPKVKSFQTPEKASGWLAYHLEISNIKPKALAKADSMEIKDSTDNMLEIEEKVSFNTEDKKKEDKKENKKEDKKKDKKKEDPEPDSEEAKLRQQISILGQMLAEAEVAKKQALIEKQKAEEAEKKVLLELEKVKNQKTKNTNVVEQVSQKKVKKETKDSGTKLILRNLLTAKQDTFPFVTEYVFAKNGKFLAFASTGDDSTFKAGVYVYNLEKQKLTQVLNKAGKHKNLVADELGTQLAFVSDTDTTAKNEKARIRNFKLYYWQSKVKTAQVLADSTNGKLKKSWIINEHQKPKFAKNGSKLYFASNPRPILQDTTLLKEEIVNVEVWSWKDQRLFTEQNARLEQEKKRGYWAVSYPKTQKVVQIATPEIPEVLLVQEGNAEYAITKTSEPYRKYTSWEGYPAYNDIYIVSFKDGNKKKLKEKLRANVNISPNGQYLYWYSKPDTAWFSYALKNGQTHNLTKNTQNVFYNEFHDYPDFPYSYGSLGWTANDANFLVYDRYDIWQFDPNNASPAKNLTQNGRSTQTTYRYRKLDPEERFLKKGQSIILNSTDETTKEEGFCLYKVGTPAVPQQLIKGEYRFRALEKAKNANRYIFTRESFTDFPDVYVSDNTFKKPEKLTYANPQQNQYLWGSVELVKWTSFDGEELDGLLYKPENFDPGKKYPMIVYYYERVSGELNRYIRPEPSWSTVRASVYTSNGYLVFMPDIPYKPGYPGKSAYNAIVSGTLNLIEKGFVDKGKMGLQGQSWGGYQTAYVITQTDLFAAAMAGAPVSNMTSAYGGIRWGSGLSRMFQYEHGQSRIGGTLWEKPMQYLENSPIFQADKVNTPLLMMHNDNDGAVPWYQGIEYFVALRRLNKPVWLLNYNGEAHNLKLRKNRKDLTIRMMQFFDYYLKFKDAPQWMEKGMPAIEKGIEQGYEIQKD